MSKSTKKQEALNEQKDWERVDQAVFDSGRFIEKYQKQLLIGVGAIVLIMFAYFAYNQFYLKPKTEEAQAAIFKGEQYFQMQQDSVAIYGDGNGYIGFESIISQYSSTKTGDLAKYYAGISYSRLGKYEKAISYLKDFSGKDKMITHVAQGAIGDCLVNTDKVEEGAKYFMDAAKSANNDLLSPIYYKKAAIAYRELKNYDKEIEIFTTIKNNYINSPEGMEADKYILEAQVLSNTK